MDGEQHAPGEGDEALLPEPGTQLLASFSSMQTPLTQLPAEAYRNLLFVSTKSPGHVQQRLAELDVPASNVGHVPLAGSDYAYDGPLWTSQTVRPNDPTGISIAVTNALQHLRPGMGYVLFEDLTVVTMYVDEETVCRLVTHLANEVRERSVTGVYGVVRSALSDETYGNFRQTVDRGVDCR